MQENFHDGCAFFHQHALEFDDMPVAAFPNRVGKELFDPYRNDVLVVAAVENRDAAIAGTMLVNAPQAIVAEFFGVRRLEGNHIDALRIEVREHMPGEAVLATGIHGLDDDQQLVPVGREKQVLEHLELLAQFLEDVEVVFLGELGKREVSFGDSLARLTFEPGLTR